jgi:hypothetical protein
MKKWNEKFVDLIYPLLNMLKKAFASVNIQEFTTKENRGEQIRSSLLSLFLWVVYVDSPLNYAVYREN